LEWPLGNGIGEATELAELSNEKRVLAVAGTQATASPEEEFVRKPVADGYVEDVLSSTYHLGTEVWAEVSAPS
jgi:predicted dehydrogenase